MQAIRAKRLIPAPGHALDDALVIFHEGRVAACGPWREEHRHYSGPVEDLGPVTVCAGVFNMHAHLELSHLLGRTLAGQGFSAWAMSLVAQPGTDLDPAVLDTAVASLAACGTAWVTDITSRNTALVAESLDRAGLGYVLGVESFGHRENADLAWPPSTKHLTPAQWERVSAAGHALYSTDAGTLRQARAWCAERGRIFPIHLAEHQGETEFLANGSGEFAELLRARLLPENYQVPGCSPVAYARDLGLLGPGTLAAHCVHLSDEDVAILADSGAAVCLCPRSNDYIGVGRAPWKQLQDAGVPLCLGTDSLSSNTDLNVWNEALAVVRGSEGAITARDVLDWLTRTPARVLGLENTHGTLESGKVAGYSIVPDELGRLL